MPKYLSLWKVNTSLVPQEPNTRLKNFEMQAQTIDSLLKGSPIKEFAFLSLETGYAIIEAASRADAMHIAALFYPYVLNEPHEIIPWELAKNSIKSAFIAQTKQAP